MEFIQKKTMDRAVEPFLSKAAESEISLAWDRYEGQLPECGFAVALLFGLLGEFDVGGGDGLEEFVAGVECGAKGLDRLLGGVEFFATTRG